MWSRPLIVASVVVFAGISGAALAQPVIEENTDRPGKNFKKVQLRAGDVNECIRLCAVDRECRAWTFVKPGVQGPTAVCFLKNPAPDPRPDRCCTSGPLPKNM